MAEFLVLRFGDIPTDPVEWVFVDQSGAQVGVPGRGDLQAAADAAAGRRVIALVPCTNVLRTFSDIPLRNNTKILQALPFALEEQLAGDVEELHFAIGKRRADGDLPVAVVERLKMEAWLEQLAAVELDLAGVYTDGDALGEMPNTTLVMLEGQRAILRDAEERIASVDADSLDSLVDLWLQRHLQDRDGDVPPPINLLIYATDAHEAQASQLGERLRSRIETLEIMTLPNGGLPRLAAQAVVAPGINLLQGPYAPRSQLSAYWPVWRIAALLLAGVAIAVLGASLLEISRLNREAERLDQAIERAMRYTFPEVREIRDARALLDSKLRTLGGSRRDGVSSDFLSTLDSVAGAVSGDADGVSKIESINYRTGVMELRVIAPNVEALDSIRETIADDQALDAEIQSANPDGESIRGRLQVKSAGA